MPFEWDSEANCRQPCMVGRGVLAGAVAAQGKGVDAARRSTSDGGFGVSFFPSATKRLNPAAAEWDRGFHL